MSLYPIDTFDGDFGGFDFGDLWDDATLVAWLVSEFSMSFRGAKCYCMQLNPVHGTPNSTFRPYGGTGLPSHPTIKSLPTIPYERLLLDNGTWPILARWFPDEMPSEHPGDLANAVWFAEIRLETNGKYVGFLKAALDTHVNNDEFVVAYREVKRRFARKTAILRQTRFWKSPEGQEALKSTHEQIRHELQIGNVKSAIQRLATMITSHHGAGFNRIMFLKATDNAISCVHAHGGDCSSQWAQYVQETLAREVTTAEELQRRVSQHIPPNDDRLYQELIGPGPLTVPPGPCLIRQIWESDGSIEGIPEQCRVYETPDLEISTDGYVLVREPYVIAAKFDLNESWVAEWIPPGRDSALRASKNGVMYILPWHLKGRLFGLWILDLGQWARCDEFRDLVPKLVVARTLLQEFAGDFT